MLNQASTAARKSKVKSQKSKDCDLRLLGCFKWSVYLRRAALALAELKEVITLIRYSGCIVLVMYHRKTATSSTPRQLGSLKGKGERDSCFLSLTLFPLTFTQPPRNIFGLADY
jgi:hypothetical protein